LSGIYFLNGLAEKNEKKKLKHPISAFTYLFLKQKLLDFNKVVITVILPLKVQKLNQKSFKRISASLTLYLLALKIS